MSAQSPVEIGPPGSILDEWEHQQPSGHQGLK